MFKPGSSFGSVSHVHKIHPSNPAEHDAICQAFKPSAAWMVVGNTSVNASYSPMMMGLRRSPLTCQLATCCSIVVPELSGQPCRSMKSTSEFAIVGNGGGFVPL